MERKREKVVEYKSSKKGKGRKEKFSGPLKRGGVWNLFCKRLGGGTITLCREKKIQVHIFRDGMRGRQRGYRL